jgi:hypothetical protein
MSFVSNKKETYITSGVQRHAGNHTQDSYKRTMIWKDRNEKETASKRKEGGYVSLATIYYTGGKASLGYTQTETKGNEKRKNEQEGRGRV